MKTEFNSLDEFFQVLKPARRQTVESICSLIENLLPQYEQVLKYNMVAYSFNNRLICVDVQTNYISIYFDRPQIIQEYKEKLPKLSFGKNSFRYRSKKDISYTIIEKIIREYYL